MREGCFRIRMRLGYIKKEAHLTSYSAQLMSHAGCLDCVQEDSP